MNERVLEYYRQEIPELDMENCTPEDFEIMEHSPVGQMIRFEDFVKGIFKRK